MWLELPVAYLNREGGLVLRAWGGTRIRNKEIV